MFLSYLLITLQQGGSRGTSGCSTAYVHAPPTFPLDSWTCLAPCTFTIRAPSLSSITTTMKNFSIRLIFHPRSLRNYYTFISTPLSHLIVLLGPLLQFRIKGCACVPWNIIELFLKDPLVCLDLFCSSCTNALHERPVIFTTSHSLVFSSLSHTLTLCSTSIFASSPIDTSLGHSTVSKLYLSAVQPMSD